MMIDDPNPSLEFDRFEDIRRGLADALVADGHALFEAEKIALYAVEGIRDVSKLMTLLAEGSSAEPQVILRTLREVLDHAQVFDKARALLLANEKLKDDA